MGSITAFTYWSGVADTDTEKPVFRKLSRDVLFHLQRKYQQPSLCDGKEPYSIPQYKIEGIHNVPRFMCLHFGRARMIWDWFMLILMVYISIMSPYNTAFKTHKSFNYFYMIDVTLEMFFACDIIINFRTTFIEPKSGKLISDPLKIAKHYLKRWFIIDCLAAFPFELLYFADRSWASFISILKLGRLIRLFRVGPRVTRCIEYTATFLALMVFSFVLLAHWVACIWYIIGVEELKSGELHGWLTTLGEQIGTPMKNDTAGSGTSEFHEYISALYFILTSLTTVGFGNIVPNTAAEKTFSVIVLLLGAIVQSAIFGNITVLIQKIYATRAKFHAKSSEIKKFVQYYDIDGELKRRVEEWFVSHWSGHNGINTEKIISVFPAELKADICLHLYQSLFTLPIFASSCRDCLRAVALKVKTMYVNPGELLVKENEAISSLYFVKHGMLEIVQKDYIVAIITTGELFGENISSTEGVKQSLCEVRALMNCEILLLTLGCIKEVGKLYPRFLHHFRHNIELSFDLVNQSHLKRTVSKAKHSVKNLDFIEEEDEMSISCENMPLWQQEIRYREKVNSIEKFKNRIKKIDFTSLSPNKWNIPSLNGYPPQYKSIQKTSSTDIPEVKNDAIKIETSIETKEKSRCCSETSCVSSMQTDASSHHLKMEDSDKEYDIETLNFQQKDNENREMKTSLARRSNSINQISLAIPDNITNLQSGVTSKENSNRRKSYEFFNTLPSFSTTAHDNNPHTALDSKIDSGYQYSQAPQFFVNESHIENDISHDDKNNSVEISNAESLNVDTSTFGLDETSFTVENTSPEEHHQFCFGGGDLSIDSTMAISDVCNCSCSSSSNESNMHDNCISEYSNGRDKELYDMKQRIFEMRSELSDIKQGMSGITELLLTALNKPNNITLKEKSLPTI